MSEKAFFVWVRNSVGRVEPQIYYERVVRGTWGDPNHILQVHELSEKDFFMKSGKPAAIDFLARRYPYKGEM